MRACSDAMPSRPRSALQRRAFWPRRCRGPCNVARAFRVRETCIHAVPVSARSFHFPRFRVSKTQEKRKERYRFKNTGGAGDTVPESWGGRFGSTSVSKNRLWSSRFQIPRLAPDFGELDSFQKPAQAIQNPDSAPRRGFWNLDRFQDPDIAMQNPDYAPRPAIWKLKDKIQIPNSETAVSVYAPALTLHRATCTSALGDVGFVIEFGGVCYQDTYPMYRACIVHVSRMYLDVSRSYTSRYIKIHRDTFVS